MKVGVVTFHSAFNFGATLQTWALQKALKQIGTEPCVINYHPWIIVACMTRMEAEADLPERRDTGI